MRIAYNTNGHTGTGQALIKVREIFSFILHVRIPYNNMMDYGPYVSTSGSTYRTHDVESNLMCSEVQLILFNSELPERLEKIYKRARSLRKAVWLFDMSIQPADEMLFLYNRSYIKRYWNNSITINGPTQLEDPNSYNISYNYLLRFFQQSNVIEHI